MDACNRNLDSPLHTAVGLRHYKIARVLVETHRPEVMGLIDVRALLNAQGETPFELARKKAYTEFYDLLKLDYKRVTVTVLLYRGELFDQCSDLEYCFRVLFALSSTSISRMDWDHPRSWRELPYNSFLCNFELDSEIVLTVCLLIINPSYALNNAGL